MSTERPLVRPFNNLEDLEKIVSGINLKVVAPSKVETIAESAFAGLAIPPSNTPLASVAANRARNFFTYR